MPNADPVEWPQGQPQFEVHWRAITESLAGNGVVNAGDLEVTATANSLEISVASGSVFYVGTTYTLGTAEQHTLSAGDASEDRWDTVYFDTGTQSSGVREGTPSANPEPPDIQGGEILLATVYVPANASNVDDSYILNWRTHSADADNTYLKDSESAYDSNTVEGALNEALRESGGALHSPISLSSFAGTAPFYLGSDPSGFGPIVDAEASDSLAAGTEVSYTFALDATTVLQIYAESDGNGGLQNVRVNTANSDIYAGSTLLYDSDTQEFQQNRLGGPASELSQYPLSLGGDTDTDVSGSDITDSNGPGTLYSATQGLFLRNVVDDKRAASGPHTADYTTQDEEIVMADTTNGTVAITLASADAQQGNVISVVDVGGSAGTNNITINTEGTETIDGGSSRAINDDYRAYVLFSDGSNWFTESGTASSSGIGVEDNGNEVLNSAAGLDFGTDLNATDNGDGTVTVDSEAAGVTVHATGTFTHTGGTATSETVPGVTTDETANLYVEVGVDSDPAFNANYAWAYDWSEAWDDTNQQVDVTINATWNTDPGSGNDVVLDYRIYSLDVSVSKSRIQNLVDSPNGHVPTSLLESGESVEITVPVADGEVLKVFRWGGYLISDGTAPTGLEVQLLDGSDTVQASANTPNTEDTATPVASYGNATGSLSVCKLRVSNATGTDYISSGVSGFFAYVVE